MNEYGVLAEWQCEKKGKKLSGCRSQRVGLKVTSLGVEFSLGSGAAPLGFRRVEE